MSTEPGERRVESLVRVQAAAMRVHLRRHVLYAYCTFYYHQLRQLFIISAGSMLLPSDMALTLFTVSLLARSQQLVP